MDCSPMCVCGAWEVRPLFFTRLFSFLLLPLSSASVCEKLHISRRKRESRRAHFFFGDFILLFTFLAVSVELRKEWSFHETNGFAEM